MTMLDCLPNGSRYVQRAGGTSVCQPTSMVPRRYRKRSLFRRSAGCGQRVVVEDRGEPSLGLGHGPALAAGVVLDLVALDLADAEIAALGMAEIEPADRGCRPHGKAFGESHADLPLAVEQRE